MKISLIFLTTTIILCSCKKDDTGVVFSLPPKTQTGQNNLGFILGTSVWTNYNQVCFPFAGGCRDNVKAYYYNNGDITVQADRVLCKNSSRNTTETIDLYLTTNFRGLINYSTITNDTIGVLYSLSEIRKPEKNYVLSATNPNFTIRLTKIDTTNKILSGEFFGTLFNKALDTTNAISLTDSITIKDGRFDVKMK